MGIDFKILRDALNEMYSSGFATWTDMQRASGVHKQAISRFAKGETGRMEVESWDKLYAAYPHRVPDSPRTTDMYWCCINGNNDVPVSLIEKAHAALLKEFIDAAWIETKTP